MPCMHENHVEESEFIVSRPRIVRLALGGRNVWILDMFVYGNVQVRGEDMKTNPKLLHLEKLDMCDFLVTQWRNLIVSPSNSGRSIRSRDRLSLSSR